MEELERMRTEFLALVSHELRAPLTSIEGSAATVLGSSTELDPAVVRQFFRINEDQADHDLLDAVLPVVSVIIGLNFPFPAVLGWGPFRTEEGCWREGAPAS